MTQQIDASRSWWLETKTREEFSAVAKQEQERMAKSPTAKIVYGLVIAWGPSISGGFK